MKPILLRMELEYGHGEGQIHDADTMRWFLKKLGYKDPYKCYVATTWKGGNVDEFRFALGHWVYGRKSFWAKAYAEFKGTEYEAECLVELLAGDNNDT